MTSFFFYLVLTSGTLNKIHSTYYQEIKMFSDTMVAIAAALSAVAAATYMSTFIMTFGSAFSSMVLKV